LPDVSGLARPGVAFHAVGSLGEVERVCLAPCEAHLDGKQWLALSLDGADPIEASEPVNLSPGAVVEGEYASRSGTRSAGWIILGLGLPSGAATIASGAGLASSEEYDTRRTGRAIVIGGISTVVISTVVGLVMGLWGDDVHVHTRPAAR
jgi:hypothetical protein